jgi:hypothetical protein
MPICHAWSETDGWGSHPEFRMPIPFLFLARSFPFLSHAGLPGTAMAHADTGEVIAGLFFFSAAPFLSMLTCWRVE